MARIASRRASGIVQTFCTSTLRCVFTNNRQSVTDADRYPQVGLWEAIAIAPGSRRTRKQPLAAAALVSQTDAVSTVADSARVDGNRILVRGASPIWVSAGVRAALSTSCQRCHTIQLHILPE